MIRYLLDTNIVSENLRPEPNRKILAQLKQHSEETAIPAIGWHELWYGVQRLEPSQRRTNFQVFLEEVVLPTMPILPYDARAAEWHAAERARLTKIGRTPPYADGQIAAIAYVNNLVLVTLNTNDYKHFQDVELADWSR